MLREKINEEFVIVLKKISKKQFAIDFVNIENPYLLFIQKLVKMCNDSRCTIPAVLKYLEQNKRLEDLNSNYSYCDDLSGAYQELSVNNREYIKTLSSEHRDIIGKKDKKEFLLKLLRNRIKRNYSTWCKAYSIKRTYEKCRRDSEISIFSHRMRGWSNPEFKISKNLSVEIKSNFGFGRSSYFISVIKFKNFKITPFSHWVVYRFAKFSEIIRYSSIHSVQNESWYDAIEFVRDASNLSLKSEKMFIEKYIIDELDKMLDGLNKILRSQQFYGFNERNIHTKYELRSYDLVNFRAEKISGSLDFIESILNFNEITETKSFVDRIERINIETQPILSLELRNARKEIKRLTSEKELIMPILEKWKVKFEKFERRIQLFEERLLKSKELKLCMPNYEIELKKRIAKKFPDYENVSLSYSKVLNEFNIIESQIGQATSSEKIVASCIAKIRKYFKTQSQKRIKL